LIAATADSMVHAPMPTGSCVIAPAMRPLLIASIWAWPESNPTIVSSPGSMPSSFTAFTMPMAEPSLVP
jgi:hypothetical protein